MGKRKKSSRKAAGPKKKDPLPIAFACLFCNHDKSVSIKIDKKAALATLECSVCGQNWQTTINSHTDLSAPVDVYGDWVDACEGLKEPKEPSAATAAPPPPLTQTSQPSIRDRPADDDDLDDLDDEA